MPVGASRYSQALEMTVAIYRAVGRELRKSGCESALVGDEGGYGPRLKHDEQALAVVKARSPNAVSNPTTTSRSPWTSPPATSMTQPAEHTSCELPSNRELRSEEMIDLLADWAQAFPIVSIEDGLAEDDWDGWAALTARLGESVQLIGDDLFATQVSRLEQGIARHAANAVLIKLNQVGTLTETLDAMVHGTERTGFARSSRPARARPRIQRSPTWPSPPPPVRSRSARWPARSGSPSTTACSASRRYSATRLASPAAPRSCRRRSRALDIPERSLARLLHVPGRRRLAQRPASANSVHLVASRHRSNRTCRSDSSECTRIGLRCRDHRRGPDQQHGLAHWTMLSRLPTTGK